MSPPARGLCGRMKPGNYINGSPAIADGQAVFGGCDGMLHVISLADGKQVKGSWMRGRMLRARLLCREGGPISGKFEK